MEETIDARVYKARLECERASHAAFVAEDRIKYLTNEIERLQNRELEEGKLLLDRITRVQMMMQTAEWRKNKALEKELAMTDHVFPEQPQPT